MPPRFQIIASGAVLAEFREVHRRATLQGQGKALIKAARKIIEGLRSDPVSVGEPLYPLPNLRLLVCVAIVSPLLVYYAVHEEMPLVVIQGFKLYSAHDDDPGNGKAQ